jgi:hypothetical protein
MVKQEEIKPNRDGAGMRWAAEETATPIIINLKVGLISTGPLAVE